MSQFCRGDTNPSRRVRTAPVQQDKPPHLPDGATGGMELRQEGHSDNLTHSNSFLCGATEAAAALGTPQQALNSCRAHEVMSKPSNPGPTMPKSFLRSFCRGKKKPQKNKTPLSQTYHLRAPELQCHQRTPTSASRPWRLGSPSWTTYRPGGYRRRPQREGCTAG